MMMNPIASCGKIGEEGDMVAGSGFETEQQGMVPLQMSRQFLEAFPVHGGGERKDLLSPLIDTTGVKLVFRYIDPDEQSHANLLSRKRKSRDRLRPGLHGHEGSKAQSTYQGSRRRGTD